MSREGRFGGVRVWGLFVSLHARKQGIFNASRLPRVPSFREELMARLVVLDIVV